MLYLKYRPKNTEEIDNRSARETIQNYLKRKEIPHALLFVGSKGSGKTSTARIVAKALICRKNAFAGAETSFEPCNTCENCRSVDRGAHADVVELDAASNRGIDDIKSLIKNASYLPMSARYRIFIIDEAHMITPDAFNALLKTLEEPEPTSVFILATTNREKIPATIASRCLTVNFGQASDADIVHMLSRVAAGEKIHADEGLFSVIVKHAEHSFRDATKILEELSVQKKLTSDEASRFLGVVREGFWDMLMKRNPADAFSWIEDFSSEGGNMKYLIEELLGDLHAFLLHVNSASTKSASPKGMTDKDIVSLIKLFTEAYQMLRICPIEPLPLEIAVAEFYNKKNPK